MKLLRDAIGSAFGGRHELYERYYAGRAALVVSATGDMAAPPAFPAETRASIFRL